MPSWGLQEPPGPRRMAILPLLDPFWTPLDPYYGLYQCFWAGRREVPASGRGVVPVFGAGAPREEGGAPGAPTDDFQGGPLGARRLRSLTRREGTWTRSRPS